MTRQLIHVWSSSWEGRTLCGAKSVGRKKIHTLMGEPRDARLHPHEVWCEECKKAWQRGKR